MKKVDSHRSLQSEERVVSQRSQRNEESSTHSVSSLEYMTSSSLCRSVTQMSFRGFLAPPSAALPSAFSAASSAAASRISAYASLATR